MDGIQSMHHWEVLCHNHGPNQRVKCCFKCHQMYQVFYETTLKSLKSTVAIVSVKDDKVDDKWGADHVITFQVRESSDK